MATAIVHQSSSLRNLQRAALVAAIALGAMLTLSSRGVAQPGIMGDPDVTNHELRLEHLRKLNQVERGMNALVKSDPELIKKIVRENDQAYTAKTVAQATAAWDAYPQVKRVFASAGLTAREYFLTIAAFASASTGSMAAKSDPANAAPFLRTAAQKANIALIEASRVEVEKIGNELQQLRIERRRLEDAAGIPRRETP